jgi:ATP-dependent DNA helicase RecG
VIALFAIAQTIAAGRQAFILAPTDMLALQHFSTAQKLLSALRTSERDSFGGRVGLLTGSIRGKMRQELLDEFRSGSVQVLVGTHALLSETVTDAASDLALVVIDEEQRFGVAQRSILEQQRQANVMYTTATPIPRSQALMALNNFSISTLSTKVSGKRAVSTSIVDVGNVSKDVVSMLKSHVPHGTKAFWICPCLLPSSSFPGSSAMERFDELTKLFPDKVGLLYGKQKSAVKSELLKQFATGDISILVATTVVEVGIGKLWVISTVTYLLDCFRCS